MPRAACCSASASVYGPRSLAGDEHGIAAHTAILSAGVRLYAAGRCDSVGAGAALASAAIDDGRATATLEALLAA
jgi:anthranilate phosphoribosyltransferase